MSAECYKHGCDLVYREAWPVGVCPQCEYERRERTLLERAAAERERLRTALRELYDALPVENIHELGARIRRALEH